MTSYEDKINAIIQDEITKCREDVVYFINNYCVIEDKDSPEVVVPFHTWAEQDRAIREIANERLNLILKARQLGFTWIAICYCVHDLIFNVGHTAVALSKTEVDAKELVRRFTVELSSSRIQGLLKWMNIFWTSTAAEVKVSSIGKPNSVFKAFPASPSAGRSFTGNILLLDEWAFQEWAEEIWTSAYPTINRPTGGKVIGLSTIKKGTLFEKLWIEDNLFNKIFLSVFADPRRTQEWYEQTCKDLGARVKEEYPRTAEEALSNIGGSFFPEFDYNLHTCEPFTIPKDWTIYNTMDYGLDMFAHYKIAIDNERNIYVFHEIYESNVIISDAATKVKLVETDSQGKPKAWYPPRVRLAPPDLWNRSQESGKSRALLFEENGLSLTKANNDREAGWMSIKELLKPIVGAEGQITSKLKIFRTCKNLIRVFPQILIDEKNLSDCAKEPHELTHALDSFRYFAISWASPPKLAETTKVKYSKSLLQDYRRANAEERALMIKRYGVPEL